MGFIFVFCFGVILGKFFSICVNRIPKEESILYANYHCNNCNSKFKCYDLIPLLSFIRLKGKCRYCGEKISVQHIIIELLTGIIFVVLFKYFNFSLDFIKYIYLFSILIISSFIDLKTQYVFFKVSLAGIIGGIIFSILEISNEKPMVECILSILIPLVILGGIILITRKIEGIGTGDLEIFILIALYITPLVMWLSIFLSICLCGVVSTFILLRGNKGRYIPFVPFITLGTFISVVFSKEIITWYLSILKIYI